MSPNGTGCGASAARCSAGSGAQDLASDIADATVLAGIAPGPAKAVVEQLEGIAGGKLGDRAGL